MTTIPAFTKDCKSCNKSKHISEFIVNKRKCNYCRECRDIMYVRCDRCRVIKRRVEMERISEESALCRKCANNKQHVQDMQFNEAFKILNELLENSHE